MEQSDETISQEPTPTQPITLLQSNISTAYQHQGLSQNIEDQKYLSPLDQIMGAIFNPPMTVFQRSQYNHLIKLHPDHPEQCQPEQLW